MRKFNLVMKTLSVAAMVFAVNLPAQAYCCKTNPAICTAICGARCCGGGLTSAPKKGSMSTIPVDQLQKEADECRGSESVIKAIDEEVRMRRAGGGATPGAAPANPAGAPMPQ